MTVFL